MNFQRNGKQSGALNGIEHIINNNVPKEEKILPIPTYNVVTLKRK